MAAAGALSLVAAACSGGETDDAVATGAQSTTSTPATADAVAESASSASSEPPATEGPAIEEQENLFPDLDVVVIDDRSTVNLADELGGGDLPVLLWFWAPH